MFLGQEELLFLPGVRVLLCQHYAAAVACRRLHPVFARMQADAGKCLIRAVLIHSKGNFCRQAADAGNPDGILREWHIRLGVVLRAEEQDIVCRLPRPDFNRAPLIVRLKADRIAGRMGDNVEQQPCVYHNAPAFPHLRGFFQENGHGRVCRNHGNLLCLLVAFQIYAAQNLRGQAVTGDFFHLSRHFCQTALFHFKFHAATSFVQDRGTLSHTLPTL